MKKIEVGVAGMIGAFCGIAGTLAATHVSEPRGADLWTVLSAIATAAATIVALYVALQTSRTRAKEERVRGRLGAARLAPGLLFNIAQFEAATKLLEQFLHADQEPAAYTTLRLLLEQVKANEPSFDLLQSIASLPDDCADRIASGFAQIKLIHDMLIQEDAFWRVDSSARETRRSKIGMLLGLAKGARETLKPTIEQCNRAALVKVGGPAVH